LHYYPAGSPPPAAASAIFTVTQQAGIIAGTGMTALNGLSADVQTISTGTTGTDFNVVSSGSNHEFNIPTASAINRGALSSANWSTFNGKQDALVSGTNIKTINGNSLLGSGDITTNPRIINANGLNLTGTTNQISASVLIPSGTLVANNTIHIRSMVMKTAGTTGGQVRLYINTTNSLTGATQIATGTGMASNNYIQQFWRSFFFDGSSLYLYSTGNPLSTDLTQGPLTYYTLNPANNYYLLFAIQNSTASPDNLGHKRVIVQIYD
jgi:hypothetical protein